MHSWRTLPQLHRGLIDLRWLNHGGTTPMGASLCWPTWIVKVDSGEMLRLAGGSFTMPAWSPDGAKLTFDLRLQTGREVWMLETKSLETLKPVNLPRER